MEMNQENSQPGSIEMQKCSICKEFVPRFDIRYVWHLFPSFIPRPSFLSFGGMLWDLRYELEFCGMIWDKSSKIEIQTI